MRKWGRQDGRRLRDEQPDPSAIWPPGATEHERAARVVARAMAVATDLHPALVERRIVSEGAAAEGRIYSAVTQRFAQLRPDLWAIATGYPSAEVRAATALLMLANQPRPDVAQAARREPIDTGLAADKSGASRVAS